MRRENSHYPRRKRHPQDTSTLVVVGLVYPCQREEWPANRSSRRERRLVRLRQRLRRDHLAVARMNQWRAEADGAGDGNRTRVLGLGSLFLATRRRPRTRLGVVQLAVIDFILPRQKPGGFADPHLSLREGDSLYFEAKLGRGRPSGRPNRESAPALHRASVPSAPGTRPRD